MCKGKSKNNNTHTSQSCFLKYGNMEQHPPIMCKAKSKSNGHVWSNTWQMQNSQNARIQMQGSVPKQRFIPICLCWKALEFHWKQRFLGATQNQKLFNLWVRTQSNDLEQGAMPNISLTLKLPLFCLGGQYQIKTLPSSIQTPPPKKKKDTHTNNQTSTYQ